MSKDKKEKSIKEQRAGLIDSIFSHWEIEDKASVFDFLSDLPIEDLKVLQKIAVK